MEAFLTMEPVAITVGDPSHVSAARFGTQRLAHGLGFDDERAGRLAIAVTEAVSNMVKHAGGGTLAARTVARGDAIGIEVMAIDSGPGMEDFGHSARDGVSTSRTAGTGLGAMQRQSDEFDIYTGRELGTIVRMVFWNKDDPGAQEGYEIGAILIPKSGETACGDAWAVEPHARGATFLVADGLGHGPDASRAANCAVDVLRSHPDYTAIRILDLAHARLRPTRGAALAVMRHDAVSGELAFAGVGNIAACVLEGPARRAMVSHNGIVGHNVHKSEEYRYSWPPGSLLVAHSDGIETQWDVAAFPGLASSHPSMIAAMLFREHSRKRDDVVVIVARATPH
jgi:anti-sigma regulatory factor (Ser/Thr protein kinase)